MRLTADHGSFAVTGQTLDFGVQVSAILGQGSFAASFQDVSSKVPEFLALAPMLLRVKM